MINEEAEKEGDLITVEVAYALAEKQEIIALKVALGTTAYLAAEQSGIAEKFPDIALESVKMGVFGKVVKAKDYVLHPGDRVEIYRPLLIDPKASRKDRAKKTQVAKRKTA